MSVGNKADISGNDLLQYWEQDDDTDVILMYLESFGNPRKFARIARRVSQHKPIVAVKCGTIERRLACGGVAHRRDRDLRRRGRAPCSARPASPGSTPSRSCSTPPTCWRASRCPPATGSPSSATPGGPGVLAADACEGAGLEVARLSARTASQLRSMLGPNAAVANPIDMVASASPDQYEAVVRLVLEDTHIDSVIVIYTPPMVSAPEPVAEAVARAVADSDKPVVANFLASRRVPVALLGRDGGRRIPSFPSPEPAAMALGRLTEYAAWRTRDPGTVPVVEGIDREAARSIVDAALEEIGPAPDDRSTDGDGAGVALDPARTEQLLAAYGIAMAGPRTATDVDETVVEVVAGVVQDQAFGPLVMFGIGDVPSELVADRAFRILPLTDRDAAELVRSLQASPLLFGYRDAPAAAVDVVEDLLLRVAALADDLPEVVEVDLNPIEVSPTAVRIVGGVGRDPTGAARTAHADPLPRLTSRSADRRRAPRHDARVNAFCGKA